MGADGLIIVVGGDGDTFGLAATLSVCIWRSCQSPRVGHSKQKGC